MPRVTAATQYRRHQLISSVFYISDVEVLMNPADYVSMFLFYRPDLWMTFDEWKAYQAAVIAAEPSMVHKAGVAYRKIERHSRAHWTYKDYGFDEMWPHLDTWYKTERKRTLQSVRNRRKRDKRKHLEELTRELADLNPQLKRLIEMVNNGEFPTGHGADHLRSKRNENDPNAKTN